MEPSKEIERSCNSCLHKAQRLNEAPAHCWDCSGTVSKPHWEPISVEPPTSTVMTKQVGGGHYKLVDVLMQPWSIVLAWGLGFHRGNVLKYLLRAPQKNGKEDIKKAIHYLEYVLENYDELKEKGLL